jgi:UDP:flavonoid glycosyltransferase YjiC (YdhE family)
MNPSLPKKRILFVGEGLTLSHIVRPLHLAEMLDRNQYEVHFACKESYRSIVEEAGIQWHPLYTLPSETFSKRIRIAFFSLYTFRDLKEYVEAELLLLKTIKPDLVVHDFRHTLATSTRLLNIPLIVIADAFWSPFSTQDFPLPENIITRIFGEKLVKSLFKPLLSLSLSLHLKPYQLLRKKYRLAPYPALRDIYTEGSQILYPDIPSLAPTRNLPPHHKYIGPLFWQPKISASSPLNDLPQDLPLLYISMGSSGNAHVLHEILEACAKLPVTAVLSTAGRKFNLSVPKNVKVFDFVPALDIIQRSSLVICHGGGSVGYQALKYGIPIIGIPSNISQFFSMEMFVKTGSGAFLSPSQTKADQLIPTIQTLLTEKTFREAAQTLSQEIPLYHTESIFLKAVEETLRSTPPSLSDLPLVTTSFEKNITLSYTKKEDDS